MRIGLSVYGTTFSMGLNPTSGRPLITPQQLMDQALEAGLQGVELPATLLQNSDIPLLPATLRSMGCSSPWRLVAMIRQNWPRCRSGDAVARCNRSHGDWRRKDRRRSASSGGALATVFTRGAGKAARGDSSSGTGRSQSGRRKSSRSGIRRVSLVVRVYRIASILASRWMLAILWQRRRSRSILRDESPPISRTSI